MRIKPAGRVLPGIAVVVQGAVLLASTAACGGRPAAPPAPATADQADAANAVVRRALSSVLQGRGAEAVATLRGQEGDLDGISVRNAATRRCMLERLGDRRLPENPVADPVVAGVLTAFRQYWLRALLDATSAEHEAWLLERLNQVAGEAGAGAAGTLDDLEPRLDSLIRARGYHVLLGVTSPLRELMLWRTETERRYDVRLPEGTQPVTVTFMDDFASLGWAGFATCDRSHSGGWTRPDRLYAVRSAYDVGSESFRVSYLAHEAQHYADNHRFPGLERQERLEYRAKLTELALADSTAHELLESFAGNVSEDPGVPHSHANGRVVRALGARLFPGAAGPPVWKSVPVERINAVARELLREDTQALAAGGLTRRGDPLSARALSGGDYKLPSGTPGR